jgi:DNA-binding MarR family transcriptional regulator
MPTLTVPSRAAVESAARELLSAPVEAARHRLQNPRELSDRIAMGRAIWRDLVIGFAAQLGELNLGFTQLAALYALADSGTMTVADLADTLGRSQSAASRLVDGLVQRQLIERNQDAEDRRLRTLTLTGRGQALLGIVDRARAQEFLSIVRPLPTAERALVAMGVAALSTHAISRRGRLIKQRPR